jgi:hypothetical protein
MRAQNIHVGDHYAITISGKRAVVRLDRANPGGGFDATNVRTGRSIRLKSGRRLQRRVEVVAGGPFDVPVRPADGTAGPTSVSELFRF